MLVFVFPALFVTYARRIVEEKRKASSTSHTSLQYQHKHSSPFSSQVWVYLMLIWAATLLTFETVNLVQRAIGSGATPSPSPSSPSPSPSPVSYA